MFRKTDYRLDKDYIPLGRMLMSVDKVEEPEEVKVCYEKRFDAITHASGLNDELDSFVEGREVDVRLRNKSNETTSKKAEDDRIFDFLIKSAQKTRTQLVTQSGDLTIAALNYAFTLPECYGFNVRKIIMHPRIFADIRLFGRDVYDESTTRDIVTNHLYGHLWTSDIYVTDNFPEDKVLLLAAPEHVGVLTINSQDILEGISILDSRSISMIHLTSYKTPKEPIDEILALIREEREHQIELGYDAESDRKFNNEQLIDAAIYYLSDEERRNPLPGRDSKASYSIEKRLIIAASLIVAEMERRESAFGKFA